MQQAQKRLLRMGVTYYFDLALKVPAAAGAGAAVHRVVVTRDRDKKCGNFDIIFWDYERGSSPGPPPAVPHCVLVVGDGSWEMGDGGVAWPHAANSTHRQPTHVV